MFEVKVSSVVTGLSALIAVLALIAAGMGLFWQNGGDPFEFSTLRGHTVQIYGQGLYRYDTLFTGAGFRGQDAVALFLGVPLLIVAILAHQRGSLSGHLLLTGVLGYFLYLYASMALGAAYNRMFLLYVAIFSASLYAFILALSSMDLEAMAAQLSVGLPRRGLAGFMVAAGFVVLGLIAVWLLTTLLRGLAGAV